MSTRTTTSLALAAILSLTACQPADEAEPSADAGPAAAPPAELPAPDLERIVAEATFLASDEMAGRDTVTPEYQEAAAWVAQAYAEIGLEPAGSESYLQRVPYLQRQLVEGSAEVIIHHPDGDVVLAYRDDFLMAGDVVRARTRVRAPMVFVGYGISAPEFGVDDFADVDVEGRIVVALSGAPPDFPSEPRAHYSSSLTKLQSAVAAGAVGWLSISTNIDRARVPWERSMRFAGRPGMAWLSESGEASRYFPQMEGGASLSPDAADALIASTGRDPAAFLQAGEDGTYEPFEFGFDVTFARSTEHEQFEGPNVIGLLPGTDPELAHEIVVLSAHLDHIGTCPADEDGDDLCNGFYDNAMGIAVMLETARMLKAVGTRRSVLLLAVSGEEKGLLGADYFANHPTLPIEDMVANVNLDMPVLTHAANGAVAFGGEHSSLGAVVAEAMASVGWESVPDPMPEQVIFVRSDHYMLVRKGIPAVFLSPWPADGELFQFLQEHYHGPSDESGLPLDLPSLEKFTLANARMAQMVADADERPSWNEGNFFGDLFGR